MWKLSFHTSASVTVPELGLGSTHTHTRGETFHNWLTKKSHTDETSHTLPRANELKTLTHYHVVVEVPIRTSRHCFDSVAITGISYPRPVSFARERELSDKTRGFICLGGKTRLNSPDHGSKTDERG